jgi:hypothetical protein
MTAWLLTAALLAADIYTYTDADGTVCYTDDLSMVPKHLREPPRPAKGGAASVAVPRRPFPLPSLSEDRWRSDVPECRDALAKVRAAQADVARGEAELNRRVTAFSPCQRFLDTCFDPALTRATWEAQCRTVPAACEVNVTGMRDYLETLRERLDELIAWLQKMAAWGCAR